MNGKIFEVGTDTFQVTPRPNAQEVQEIAYVAFVEASSLSQEQKAEVGNYLAKLAKNLLEEGE